VSGGLHRCGGYPEAQPGPVKIIGGLSVRWQCALTSPGMRSSNSPVIRSRRRPQEGVAPVQRSRCKKGRLFGSVKYTVNGRQRTLSPPQAVCLAFKGPAAPPGTPKKRPVTFDGGKELTTPPVIFDWVTFRRPRPGYSAACHTGSPLQIVTRSKYACTVGTLKPLHRRVEVDQPDGHTGDADDRQPAAVTSLADQSPPRRVEGRANAAALVRVSAGRLCRAGRHLCIPQAGPAELIAFSARRSPATLHLRSRPISVVFPLRSYLVLQLGPSTARLLEQATTHPDNGRKLSLFLRGTVRGRWRFIGCGPPTA